MANYNPYNVSYNVPYNDFNNEAYMREYQSMKDRIDAQMRQLQQRQMQQSMQPQIHQNFQLAPTTPSTDLESKYAENIEEVRSTFVMKTGIFVTKDFTTVWIKDVTGNIKTYKLEEVIEIDPKDQEINDLKRELASVKALITQQNNKVDVIQEKPRTQNVPQETRKKTK